MRLRSLRAWIPTASVVLASLALLPPAGCAQLAPLAEGSCGNGVVDSNEDCDGFPRGDGTSCRPPDAVGACRLDCTKSSDGWSPACPGGWRCGSDQLCRAPSGKFEPPRVIGQGATQIALADFDADGRKDVVAVDDIDARGIGHYSVRYFDDRFGLAKTTDLGQFRETPAVVLPIDGSSPSLALAPAGAGVAFLRGRLDRAFDASIQSSYFVSQPIYGVIHRSNDDAIAILTTSPGSTDGRYVWLGFEGGSFGQAIPGSMDSSFSKFIRARLTPQATCESIAYIDTPGVIAVVPLCHMAGWNTSDGPVKVAFDSGARSDGFAFGDLNADSVLDLVVSADPGLEVAYGASAELFDLVTFAKPVRVSQLYEGSGALLAVGDVNFDGVPDFARSNGLVTSATSASALIYKDAFSTTDTWSNARFADLDGDGSLDLIASSATRVGLTFIKGGPGALLRATITTPGIDDSLSVGDFDGDLISDVAYRERYGGKTSIGILFGHAGLPGPAVSELDVNALVQVEAIDGRYDVQGNTSPAHLLVLDAPGSSSHVSYVETSSARQVVSPTFTPDGDPVLAVAPDTSDATTASALALVLLTIGDGHSELSLQSIRSNGGGAVDLRDLDDIATTNLFVSSALLARGDVNGDGNDDAVVLFAVTSSVPGDPSSVTRMNVILGDGGTHWQYGSSRRYSLSIDSSSKMALVDLDGDGALDIVVLARGQAESNVLDIRWNDGNGNFVQSTAPGITQDPYEQFAGFALVTTSPAAPPSLVFATNGNSNGSATFYMADFVVGREPMRRSILESKGGLPTSMTGGDFDGDGVDDIVYVDDTGLVLVRGVPTQP